jgi:hypothetical protein
MKVKIDPNKVEKTNSLFSRKERRNFMKKNHISMKTANAVFQNYMIKNEAKFTSLPQGTKVMLKYDQIISKSKELSDGYLKFVNDHKDQVMTVVYDEKRLINPLQVCLEEDTSEIKWLFDTSELEVVPEILEIKLDEIDEETDKIGLLSAE